MSYLYIPCCCVAARGFAKALRDDALIWGGFLFNTISGAAAHARTFIHIHVLIIDRGWVCALCSCAGCAFFLCTAALHHLPGLTRVNFRTRVFTPHLNQHARRGKYYMSTSYHTHNVRKFEEICKLHDNVHTPEDHRGLLLVLVVVMHEASCLAG